MKLDDLLRSDESVVGQWLRSKELLHECDCGYTVYDPDDVNSAVQRRWGGRRCDEIRAWSCDLADRFGWLWIESARPDHEIYHCQHCHESELSLFLDFEKIASAKPKKSRKTNKTNLSSVPTEPKPKERLIVYLDESYTAEFPRKEGGSLAYGALIIPESHIQPMEDNLKLILKESYRGTAPKELKYNKIAKHAGLLERVGARMVELLCHTHVAVVGIFVPRSGFFGERTRSIKAVAQYGGSGPKEADLQDVESSDSVEDAVRNAPNDVAQALAACIANYVGSDDACATLVFDPRSKELDEPLLRELQALLPKTPINVPHFRHGDAIVTILPHTKIETLGSRVTCELIDSSHESCGLQVADFLAGDIRAFFSDAEELLNEALYAEPLTNRRALFPEVFRVGKISNRGMEKVRKRTGKSFLPLYRHRLVNGLISYYTRNGQMRNFDTDTGDVFDLLD